MPTPIHFKKAAAFHKHDAHQNNANIHPTIPFFPEHSTNSSSNNVDALNDQFIQTVEKIEQISSAELPKHLRIRVEAWCKKLCQVHTNEVFLRNRNAHAELLLSCCMSNNFTEPFNRIPSEGPLASLPTHVTVMIKQRKLEKQMELTKEQSRRIISPEKIRNHNNFNLNFNNNLNKPTLPDWSQQSSPVDGIILMDHTTGSSTIDTNFHNFNHIYNGGATSSVRRSLESFSNFSVDHPPNSPVKSPMRNSDANVLDKTKFE